MKQCLLYAWLVCERVTNGVSIGQSALTSGAINYYTKSSYTYLTDTLDMSSSHPRTHKYLSEQSTVLFLVYQALSRILTTYPIFLIPFLSFCFVFQYRMSVSGQSNYMNQPLCIIAACPWLHHSMPRIDACIGTSNTRGHCCW